MEKFQTLLREATQRFANADHVVYVTYPLLNDPKLIIVIIGHLYNSLVRALEALIEYEYYQKRIDYLPRNLKDRIFVFRDSILKRYGFSENIIKILEDLHKIMEFREKSPVEFMRKNTFVICDDNYSTKMINFQKIKKYAIEIKSFIQQMKNVIE